MIKKVIYKDKNEYAAVKEILKNKFIVCTVTSSGNDRISFFNDLNENIIYIFNK